MEAMDKHGERGEGGPPVVPWSGQSGHSLPLPSPPSPVVRVKLNLFEKDLSGA